MAAQPAGMHAPQAGGVPPADVSWDDHVRNTIRKLHEVYMTSVKPLEDKFKYDLFRPSWYEETILNSKPFVTFFGPWSAGKSTFINNLLQSNYLWTGPQPTTADFTAIVYGEEPGDLDGRVIVNAKELPFKGLNEFGENFLQNFKGFQAPHDLLKSVTLIDTPGVLESAQEIHQRKYDYIRLARWFAERSDLVFVMFDPTKLDAGVELRLMFKVAFKGQEGKVRIVLNKADSVNTQELMRVYGSLFWNLSNMINSTEPPRVYIGSFWDQPYQEGTFHLLFSEEKADLIQELTQTIPRQALDKKISSLIQRAKAVFVHAAIIGIMRQNLPSFFGKDKAKRKAIDDLPKTYEQVGAKFKMNWRDFPPVEEYRTFLEKFDLETFPSIEKVDKEGMLGTILNTIETVLPRMLKPVRASKIADPRDKEALKKLQEGYTQSITNQVQGVQGIQGSSDIAQTGRRDFNFHNVASPMAGSGSQASGSPPPSNAAGQQPPMMNPQMMQMMQMMMQMQQQPQQQVPQLAAPPPPPPQQQQAQGGMTPEQMQMMMQMMQQQQQQQQQYAQPQQFPPQQSGLASSPTVPSDVMAVDD
jgi:GTP-binding protein EngB required for normal cell division